MARTSTLGVLSAQRRSGRHMYTKLVRSVMLGLALTAQPALATMSLFTTSLSGAQEVPPNVSPATGTGTVVLDDVAKQITVDESWSGLTASAAASQIQGPAPPGVNAVVVFPFTGVPAATSGSIPEQTFVITPTQIGQLQAGLFYMNIHTSTFPGGEIRGQLMLATSTPTSTPTQTATSTPTATPTDTPTRQPNGSSCTAPVQCATGFCANGVCCNTACSDPLMHCNLTGQRGTCASAAASAPTLTPWGLLIASLVLASIAGLALRRRMRSR